MTGWNLPPGCNVNDIPGNRPEDLLEEEFAERVGELVAEQKLELPEDWPSGDIWKLVEIVRGLEYNRGFEDGRAEEAERTFYEQVEVDRAEWEQKQAGWDFGPIHRRGNTFHIGRTGLRWYTNGWSIDVWRGILSFSVTTRQRSARVRTEHYNNGKGYHFFNLTVGHPNEHKWWAFSATLYYKENAV